MNRNQAMGSAKDLAGKAQRKVGETTGNKTQQVKGGARQVEGKLQKGAGDLEQSNDRANRKTR